MTTDVSAVEKWYECTVSMHIMNGNIKYTCCSALYVLSLHEQHECRSLNTEQILLETASSCRNVKWWSSFYKTHTHTKTLTLDSLWYQSYCQRSSLSITEGRVNSGAVCCLISKTCGHEEANIKSQKHIHSGEIHKNAPPNVIVISSPFVFPPQFVSLSASGRIFWAVLITRGSCLCEPLRLFAAKDNKFFNTQRDTNLGKHKLEAPQDFYVMKVIDRITV